MLLEMDTFLFQDPQWTIGDEFTCKVFLLVDKTSFYAWKCCAINGENLFSLQIGVIIAKQDSSLWKSNIFFSS